jgi:hypothetical protein
MMKITKLRPCNKGALRAFFNIEIEKMGIEIRDMALYQKNGNHWVNLPSREFEVDGEKRWAPLIRFTKDHVFKTFREKACEAALAYVNEHAINLEFSEPATVSVQQSEEGFPF